MQKLINYRNKYIRYGTVFRLLGQAPYENFVDFMVIDKSTEYLLIVSSGCKSGEVLLCFPKDAYTKDENISALESAWIIANWNKCIYPECAVEDVYILPSGYPVPSIEI